MMYRKVPVNRCFSAAALEGGRLDCMKPTPPVTPALRIEAAVQRSSGSITGASAAIHACWPDSEMCSASPRMRSLG